MPGTRKVDFNLIDLALLHLYGTDRPMMLRCSNDLIPYVREYVKDKIFDDFDMICHHKVVDRRDLTQYENGWAIHYFPLSDLEPCGFSGDIYIIEV